jgi:hypothetical protein
MLKLIYDIYFENVGYLDLCDSLIETCQVQYLYLGSLGFQWAKHFQSQRSRSWWNGHRSEYLIEIVYPHCVLEIPMSDYKLHWHQRKRPWSISELNFWTLFLNSISELNFWTQFLNSISELNFWTQFLNSISELNFNGPLKDCVIRGFELQSDLELFIAEILICCHQLCRPFLKTYMYPSWYCNMVWWSLLSVMVLVFVS